MKQKRYARMLGMLVGVLSVTILKFKPSLFYRYAFMQGDDPTTSTYERYDPLLSSGLATGYRESILEKLLVMVI
jgi:hypothetical protein